MKPKPPLGLQYGLIAIVLCLDMVSNAQDTITEMDECALFSYLSQLAIGDSTTWSIVDNKKALNDRIATIQRIDFYPPVCDGFKIYPVLLDTVSTTIVRPFIFKGQAEPFDSMESVFTHSCSEFINEVSKYYCVCQSLNKSRQKVQKKHTVDVTQTLIELCHLDRIDNTLTELLIAEMKETYTIERLYFQLKNDYSDAESSLSKLPELIKEENLKLLAERLEKRGSEKYTYYKNYDSKPKVLQGFEMYHGNDVLNPIPNINQDREMTGQFGFTVITDYLRWRWLRLSNKKENDVLTYQTLSLKGEGFTPYIRYRNNYELADTLHQLDRPFASYVVIERAKNRLWKRGLVRHTGKFQLGFMGVSSGRTLQKILHRDVITESQFVYGWDNQIAPDSRLVFQLNHNLEVLLYSNTNRYRSCLKPNNYRIYDKERYAGINISAEASVMVGSLMTNGTIGLRFSTLDFLKQSANQMIQSKPGTRDNCGWKLDMGIAYRYVQHNSTLTGLGIIRPFKENPYELVSEDPYTLSTDEVRNHLFLFDIGATFKWRKSSLFLRMNLKTLEYQSRLQGVNLEDPAFIALIDERDLEFYRTKVIPEQQTFLNRRFLGAPIYSFGTVGMNWLIE